MLQSLFFKTFIFSVLMISVGCFAQNSAGIIDHIQQDVPGTGKVSIRQSDGISKLLNAYYIQNASKPGMQGFRIRLYFDLGQQSRTVSEDVMNQFMENYPGVSVYRSFDSPYYKVSVGDFRTRDEALKFLKTIERKYPKAFIVPEWINFPQLN